MGKYRLSLILFFKERRNWHSMNDVRRSVKRTRHDYPNESEIIVTIEDSSDRVAAGRRNATSIITRGMRIRFDDAFLTRETAVRRARRMHRSWPARVRFLRRGQSEMSRYPTKRSTTNEITSPSYGRGNVIGLRKTAHVPSRDVPAWLASDAPR